MTTDKESRPVGNPDGFHKTNFVGTSSLAQFPASAAIERAQDVLLLMVYSPETGRYRRRIFLSLHAAARSAEKARARGHIAHVVLGRFTAGEVV